MSIQFSVALRDELSLILWTPAIKTERAKSTGAPQYAGYCHLVDELHDLQHLFLQHLALSTQFKSFFSIEG